MGEFVQIYRSTVQQRVNTSGCMAKHSIMILDSTYLNSKLMHVLFKLTGSESMTSYQSCPSSVHTVDMPTQIKATVM